MLCLALVIGLEIDPGGSTLLVMANHSLTSEFVGSQGCYSSLLSQLTWLGLAWDESFEC